LAAASGKRDITVWRPSICLSRLFANLTYSTWLISGQRTFGPNNEVVRHTY